MSATAKMLRSQEAQDLPRFFARYQPIISEALQSEMSDSALGVYRTHSYYMGWSDKDGEKIAGSEGKRLRPTLTLLSSDVLGGDIGNALPIATALEYVHNFSLIHDDLEDHDQYRHHRPTVWVVWDEATAIISGNLMIKIADQAARGLVDRGIDHDEALRIQGLIAKAYLRMMEGQFLDLAYETRSHVSINDYLAMIDRKTGALIEASIYLGARVAVRNEDDDNIVDGLRRIGFEMGRLFQVRDDMLGVWGGEETGKPVGADLRRKKKALPAIHALNVARGASGKRINELFEGENIDDRGVDDLLQIMDDVDTRRYCEKISETHLDAVTQIINTVEIAPWAKRDLSELGSYLVNLKS